MPRAASACAAAALLLLSHGASAHVCVCTSNSTLWCECATGAPLHAGAPAEGLLLNSRMIQAFFADANASTVGNWAYPDGSPYDPDRQVAEFMGNLTSYAACGLDAFTVGMQGGGPGTKYPPDQPWEASGFTADGTPLPAYLDRLSLVLAGARAAGLTPIVQFFYQGQIERLAGDAAVASATAAMVDWLADSSNPWWVGGGHGNPLLVDIANEVGTFNASYTSLQRATIHALITASKARPGVAGRLLVSSSFLGTGNGLPDADAVAVSDYVLVHCNGQTPTEVVAHVAGVRALPAWIASPKPIVYNECGTNTSVYAAAIGAGAGWGYYDQGTSNYVDGFQSPPTNWRLGSSAPKTAFARLTAKLGGATDTCGV